MPKQPDAITFVVGDIYPLEIDDLKPNPHQVRQHFDAESIKALAKSIEEDGLLQNIAFTEHEGELIIVAGERRYRALKLLKEQGKDIPLKGKYVVGSLRKLAFVENLFREDLTAVEFSESLLALQEETDLSQGALGELIGLKRTTVNGYIAVAKMDESIKKKVRTNPDIPRERLVKIARINGNDRQHKAVDALIKEFEAKEEEKAVEKAPKAKSTRGKMAAEGLAKFTKGLGRFATEKYGERISPADRDLIASRLTEMQTEIQKTLDAMSQGKEQWDKLYAEKTAKFQTKKNVGSTKKAKVRKKK